MKTTNYEEAKLKQYEASIIEHDEIKRISSAVQDENKKVTFDLEQSVEQVRLHQSELEELDLLEKSKTLLAPAGVVSIDQFFARFKIEAL